jgi:hypothetical protein
VGKETAISHDFSVYLTACARPGRGAKWGVADAMAAHASSCYWSSVPRYRSEPAAGVPQIAIPRPENASKHSTKV